MNKKLILIALLIISSLIIISCSEDSVNTNSDNEPLRYSTWIWDSRKIHKETTKKLLEMNINMVSINAGYEPSIKEQYLLNHKGEYNTFIKSAQDKNIKVYALFGTPLWSYTKEYDYMAKQLKEVFDYNNTYLSSRFNGIHLDIEPHAITGINGLNLWETWNTRQREGIIKEFISNLKDVRKLIDDHNKKNNDNIELIIDLAPAIPEYETFAGRIFKVIDRMVLMNYTKYNNIYLENGEKYLKLGDKYNKSVIIGSEYQKNYDDYSLYSLKALNLKEYFKKPIEAFKGYKSFNGLGVHGFFDYYEKLH